MRLTGIVTIGCLAVATALPAGAAEGSEARVLTVAKSGGQYTTIQAAADASQPGDVIEIAAGTYQEALRPRSGAAGQPIVFQARGGERVVVDGNKTLRNGSGLVNLDDRSWVHFVGITFTRSPTHGIYGYRTSNLVFRNCEVSSSTNGGLVILAGDSIEVDGCDVHHNNDRGTSASHEAISIAEGSTNFVVKNNKVHHNGEEGIDAKYNDNAAGKIHDNLVYDNRGPNIYVDSSSNVEVYNNTSSGAWAATKAGIAVAVEDWATARRARNIKIYNNIAYGNAGGGVNFWIQSSGTISGISIVNNTLVSNSGSAIVGAGHVTGSGSVVRNNLFFGNSPGIGGSFVADTNFTGDPQFVDPAARDYHLRPGSPAIDAGNPTGAPAFDRDNEARPQGTKVDIGAYEQ